jgi:hypothetical protein
MVKKVDEANLGKLFRIDRVVITKGKADFGKRSAGGELSLSGIWGNNVVLAYVSTQWDEPCAGKTVSVKYAEADGQGWIVRTWKAEDGGILGGEWVQVAHDVIVAKESRGTSVPYKIFLKERNMRAILVVLLLALAGLVYAKEIAPSSAQEGIMAYCTLEDLQGNYGEDRIAAGAVLIRRLLTAP